MCPKQKQNKKITSSVTQVLYMYFNILQLKQLLSKAVY